MTPLIHSLLINQFFILHLHGVHFEEHLKTIWIPTPIPLLKIKVGKFVVF